MERTATRHRTERPRRPVTESLAQAKPCALVLRGLPRINRPSNPAAAYDGLVEGHVLDRRRLLLDAGVPTEHCISRRRYAVPCRHVRADLVDALRRAPDVQPGGRDEPARPGQHPHSRGLVSEVERQGPGPMPSW